MAILTKISNGWQLAVNSLKVLNANKQLIIFPVLSLFSMALITGSLGYVFLPGFGWNAHAIDLDGWAFYALLFVYYIVNYFVVVFFNMALMHCERLYFEGEEVTISKGLQFSAGRVLVIFQWAVFSATVGVILKIAQDNLGWLGRTIIGVIGIGWGLTTFLVVPVLAYEQLGPLDAVKRSAQLMTEKWGEGISASFSFGLIFLVVFMVLAVGAFGITYYVSEGAGIMLAVAVAMLLFVVSGAVQSIFVSALYANVNGRINNHFGQKVLDNLFES